MSRGTLLIVDVRDLTWEYRIAKSKWVRLSQFILKVFSIYALRRAEMVISTNASEQNYLKKYVKSERNIVIPNGVESDFLAGLKQTSVSLDAKGSNNKPTILYAGTIGVAQGVDILLLAARGMQGCRFKIVGDGSEFFRIQKSISDEGLLNVNLISKVPKTKMPDLYLTATVLFLRLGEGFETAVPSKIYEYLSLAKPIVFMGSYEDAAWNLLSKFDGVFLVPDNNVTYLKEAF